MRIDMGGWRTPSTKEAINIFFNHIDANVHMVRKDWKYLLVTKTQRKIASFGSHKDETPTPVVFLNVKTNRVVKGFQE